MITLDGQNTNQSIYKISGHIKPMKGIDEAGAEQKAARLNRL